MFKTCLAWNKTIGRLIVVLPEVFSLLCLGDSVWPSRSLFLGQVPIGTIFHIWVSIWSLFLIFGPFSDILTHVNKNTHIHYTAAGLGNKRGQ